jgi:enoyl-CoA hydratase
MIEADEAERIGLVNHAVPREELDETVDEIVEAIQSTGRSAVKNSKRAFNHAVDAQSAEENRAFEAEVWWEQFATDERERLVDEFNDK